MMTAMNLFFFFLRHPKCTLLFSEREERENYFYDYLLDWERIGSPP